MSVTPANLHLSPVVYGALMFSALLATTSLAADDRPLHLGWTMSSTGTREAREEFANYARSGLNAVLFGPRLIADAQIHVGPTGEVSFAGFKQT